MVREPETGVMRAVQMWLQTTLRTDIRWMSEGVEFIAEDEGDFESEIDKRLSREGIAVFIATPAMTRVNHVLREVSCAIKVFESVKLHRSTNRVPHWTALRVAEEVLATLDHTRMDASPWAVFEGASNAITLESQTPWLVYDVQLVAKLKLMGTTV